MMEGERYGSLVHAKETWNWFQGFYNYTSLIQNEEEEEYSEERDRLGNKNGCMPYTRSHVFGVAY